MGFVSGRSLVYLLLAVMVGCRQSTPLTTPEPDLQETCTEKKTTTEGKEPESSQALRLAAEEEAEKNMDAIARYDHPLPLQNVPVVTQLKHSIVAIKNAGESTLLYRGWGNNQIHLWQEIDEGGWVEGKNASWKCGTFGGEDIEILPGKTAYYRIRFLESDKREWMWGAFREKGTARQDRVILATEPEIPRDLLSQ